jgi:hypothetical protein
MCQEAFKIHKISYEMIKGAPSFLEIFNEIV